MSHLAQNQHPSIALYAFSADPITYGHINIVERMARSFSHCIIGIGRNPAKQYLFDLTQRLKLAQQALVHIPNVEVLPFEGLLVDFAFEQGASVIVKGIRNAADMEYENTLHQVGASQELDIDTHILFADPKLAHVSSSVVKGMQLEHGFIHHYVPPMVKAALEARLSRQLVIGLTGSIASGKSTLANKLIAAGQSMKLPVFNIDLDKLGHDVLAGKGIGQPMFKKLTLELVALFGEDILEKQIIQREKIAKKVFQSIDARHQLNAIMLKPMSILLRKVLKRKTGLVLLNGALLADLDWLALCNYRCINCNVDSAEQMSRMLQRGHSVIESNERISAQLDSVQKQSVIESAIKQHNFGKLWTASSDIKAPNNLGKQLLQQILSDCKEFKWKC